MPQPQFPPPSASILVLYPLCPRCGYPMVWVQTTRVSCSGKSVSSKVTYRCEDCGKTTETKE